MEKYMLGISCFYHDSAAALIKNGEILAAAQEERFSRKKHDSGFPLNAIRYCLKSQKIDLRDVESIIYYEKPLLTFERLLETYLGVAPVIEPIICIKIEELAILNGTPINISPDL